MNEKEAYALLAKKLEIDPALVPYLNDVCLDLTVLNPIRPASIKRLGPLLDLRPGKKVLDLGCGKAGVSLPLVRTYQVRLTGIDLMPDFIRECWARAEGAGLHHLCDFQLEDAALFVARTQAKWDAVLNIGILTAMWADVDEGMKALKPLVAAGGHLVIGLPYVLPQGQTREGADLKSREALTEILARYGRVVEIIDDGNQAWDEEYILPQKRAIERLVSSHPGQADLKAFLDWWLEQLVWESRNLGFAMWVIKPE